MSRNGAMVAVGAVWNVLALLKSLTRSLARSNARTLECLPRLSHRRFDFELASKLDALPVLYSPKWRRQNAVALSRAKELKKEASAEEAGEGAAAAAAGAGAEAAPETL